MSVFNIAFGNTDHGLTQKDWSDYSNDLFDAIDECAYCVLGEYYSAPNAAFQQGMFVFKINNSRILELKEELVRIREKYGKKGIYWNATQSEEL